MKWSGFARRCRLRRLSILPRRRSRGVGVVSCTHCVSIQLDSTIQDQTARVSSRAAFTGAVCFEPRSRLFNYATMSEITSLPVLLSRARARVCVCVGFGFGIGIGRVAIVLVAHARLFNSSPSLPFPISERCFDSPRKEQGDGGHRRSTPRRHAAQ